MPMAKPLDLSKPPSSNCKMAIILSTIQNSKRYKVIYMVGVPSTQVLSPCSMPHRHLKGVCCPEGKSLKGLSSRAVEFSWVNFGHPGGSLLSCQLGLGWKGSLNTVQNGALRYCNPTGPHSSS